MNHSKEGFGNPLFAEHVNITGDPARKLPLLDIIGSSGGPVRNDNYICVKIFLF